MTALAAEALLDGLNDAQQTAVTSDTIPLCILAGAGSGKTRVLTRRIAYRAATGTVDPRRVLSLTFTRKAAGELTRRLRALGLRDSVAAGTFHAVAYAQLRTRWLERNVTPPELLDRKVGFVAPLIPRSMTVANRNKTATMPFDVVTEIEWAKARMISPSDYPRQAASAHRLLPVSADDIAEVFERYEIEKRKRRLVDFDDLLRLHARDVKADPDYAAAIRWRFQHLYVDEFQDVNKLQHSLLQAWLGDRNDLCVVGDPNQAIYAWNGADARYLDEFDRYFPGCEIVQLQDNYRSTPQVLAVANAVLHRPAAERGGRGRRPRPTTALLTLRATRPDGPIPTIRRFDDDEAEAAGIARAVRDARAPRSAWSTQAVLVRTNAQIPVIERALRAAGIPRRVRGSAGLLDQPEIKAAVRTLQGTGTNFSVALRDLELDVLPDADESAEGHFTERQRNVQTLIRLGRDFALIDPSPSIAGFLAWLSDTVRADEPDHGGDAVDIVTFHAAKGLEWPIVHLAGLEQGLVPIAHAKTPAEQAEERRLFYVALTRAQHELRLSWAATRTFGSRVSNRVASSYLDDVQLVCDELHGTPAVDGDWMASLDEQRATLRATSPPSARDRRARRGQRREPASLDPAGAEILDRLQTWRARMAKVGSIPPEIVLDSATLTAIARAQPASADALAAIPGIGPVKLQRYGDTLLELVAGTRSE